MNILVNEVTLWVMILVCLHDSNAEHSIVIFVLNTLNVEPIHILDRLQMIWHDSFMPHVILLFGPGLMMVSNDSSVYDLRTVVLVYYWGLKLMYVRSICWWDNWIINLIVLTQSETTIHIASTWVPCWLKKWKLRFSFDHIIETDQMILFNSSNTNCHMTGLHIPVNYGLDVFCGSWECVVRVRVSGCWCNNGSRKGNSYFFPN